MLALYPLVSEPKMAATAAANQTLLVGNDGIEVAFELNHINQLNYIKELVSDTNETKIPVDVFSKSLLLLQDLLTLKDTTGIPFKLSAQIKTYRGIETKVPTYSGIDDPWASGAAAGIYYDKLSKILVPDLCELFAAADYLGCDDILHGVAYVLIQHMLNYTGDVCKHLTPHSKSILAKIHIANI